MERCIKCRINTDLDPNGFCDRCSGRNDIDVDAKFVPIEKFGKDHWSTLAYVGCRVVDNEGTLERDHMRCNSDRHPGLANRANLSSAWDPNHGTRLNGYFDAEGDRKTKLIMSDHDDWDCLDDLEAAGLIRIGGSGINPMVSVTDFGRNLEAQLRKHKSAGGMFAGFGEAADLARAMVGTKV